MKNLVKHILVFAIVFATLSSNATEVTSFTNEEDGKTTLVFNNVLEGDRLLVKDVYGTILYKEAILKSGQYNKSFDLTSLPDGDYFFELDKKMQTRIYPFTVVSTTVKFDKENSTIINKPRVKGENSTIFVTTSSSENVNYKVDIFYNSTKIYSETFKDIKNIGKKFKLLQDKKGDYSVEITTKGRTFSYVINL